jgi:hypothetical protein
MEQHDIEVRIGKDGKVQIHIKGAKGEQCMSYVDLFEGIVGPVKERRLTHEYFEPDGRVRTDARSSQQVHEAEP